MRLRVGGSGGTKQAIIMIDIVACYVGGI